MMKFWLYRQYLHEWRTQSETLDHGGATCLGGFDMLLTRRAYILEARRVIRGQRQTSSKIRGK